MQIDDICKIKIKKSPVIATAIHAGHRMRKRLKLNSKLKGFERLREEDPYTDIIAKASKSYIIAKVSRFEVDLNRPRDKAVYLEPRDAWGLELWKKELSIKDINHSLKEYDLFYERLKKILDKHIKSYKQIVVLDIHSYNHRRRGKKAPFDDTVENPEINVGTETILDRDRWQNIIDICKDSLSNYEVMDRYLDVRENVKFKGGYMAKWINSHYPDSVCCISLEFKKIFMNEWNGKCNEIFITQLNAMLKYTIKKIDEKLKI